MPTLLIEHPSSYLPERRYIYHVLLKEFLGLDFQCQITNREDTRIILQDDPQQSEIVIKDALFCIAPEKWLTSDSCPQEPLACLQTANIIGADKLPKQIPVLYGAESTNAGDGNYYQETQNQVCWSIDIFGSSFFCLTRYEELARPSQDSRDRFPATASLAYREGFLDRPIVNEYIELLWLSFKRLWPVLVSATTLLSAFCKS